MLLDSLSFTPMPHGAVIQNKELTGYYNQIGLLGICLYR